MVKIFIYTPVVRLVWWLLSQMVHYPTVLLLTVNQTVNPNYWNDYLMTTVVHFNPFHTVRRKREHGKNNEKKNQIRKKLILIKKNYGNINVCISLIKRVESSAKKLHKVNMNARKKN